jgi:hypothetical protein
MDENKVFHLHVVLSMEDVETLRKHKVDYLEMRGTLRAFLEAEAANHLREYAEMLRDDESR